MRKDLRSQLRFIQAQADAMAEKRKTRGQVRRDLRHIIESTIGCDDPATVDAMLDRINLGDE